MKEPEQAHKFVFLVLGKMSKSHPKISKNKPICFMYVSCKLAAFL